MKRKWFVLSAIATIAMVGMFVFENTALAHQLVRNKRQHLNVNPSRIARVNPLSVLNKSWIDLTFSVKANEEILAKARPIYQETRDALQKQIKEARKTVRPRAAVKKIQGIVKKTDAKFNASLKEVLTEEQMTKLTKLTKKRRVEARKRLNRVLHNQREYLSHRRHR